jgi:glycosyltransferase involved in cell wall biosynthesis
MIVKNEEKYLADCLNSVKGIVDQIIIVDTGSVDDTLKIAQKFGAEIYSFTWIGDFAASRNESIKYAKGDWILWLDADERLDKKSKPFFKSLPKETRRATAYKIKIHNRMNDGKTIKITDAHRLFNNKLGIRFSGKIHEQIAPSINELKGIEKEAPVMIHHLGYGLTFEEQAKKNERNRVLLEQVVMEDSQNAYNHYTIAQHYGLTGNYKKALEHYAIAENINTLPKQMSVSMYNFISENYMKIGDYRSALEYALKSIKQIPNQAGAFYLKYRISLLSGKLKNAVISLEELYLKTLKLRKNSSSLASDIILSDETIFECFKEIQQKLLCVENWQASEIALKNMLKIKKEETVINTLAVVYIKLGMLEKAAELYEEHIIFITDKISAYKRLAGVYGKLGRMAEAENIIRTHLAGK